MRIWWSIVSRAALRSSSTRSVIFWGSTDTKTSLWTFSKAVSVGWNLRNPDCEFGRGALPSQCLNNRGRTVFSTILEINGRLLTGRKFFIHNVWFEAIQFVERKRKQTDAFTVLNLKNLGPWNRIEKIVCDAGWPGWKDFRGVQCGGKNE